MIELSEALLRGQRARTILAKHLLIRCVLTYGNNTYTYTKTRIKELSHTRQSFSHKAQLMLDDTDKVLHGLNLEGYKAVISRGLITQYGEEWVDLPPLWVYGQQRDSYRDRLECSLSLEGIFDRMGKHKAEAPYTPASGDTRTVKDWLTQIISLTDPVGAETDVEQTESDSYMPIYDGLRFYVGQRLTISDKTVTKLAFKLRKVGNPVGEVVFSIYTVDEDDPLEGGELLATKAWGDASNLGTSSALKEVTFDTPVQIDQEVRIICSFRGGSASNYVDFAYEDSDEKADEHLTWIYLTSWTDHTTYDAAYRYSYSSTPVTVYDNYPAYGLVFDSEDDLIDTFIPADSFRINLNDTRLQKVKELLRYTDCIILPKNDGLLHVIDPTTSGTTYDNEYTLVVGRDYHNFFSKRFRRRIVSPNYLVFKNHPAHDDSYTGYAKDASADLKDMREIETHYVRATSDAQCTNLATAFLLKKQLAAEKGSAILPFVHFGQEVYDYVNFVDARAGDNRAGNVGFLSEYYKPSQNQFNMHIGFGRGPLGVPALQGLVAEAGVARERLTAENLLPLIDDLYSYVEQIIDILEGKVDIDELNEILLALYEDAYFRKATVTEQILIPSEAA